MEEANTKDKFIVFLLLLFVIFLVIYISNGKDYYEYKAYNKTILTKENIKRFENDVDAGKNVSINDYVVSNYVDYSNTLSDFGYDVGNLVEKVMNKGIKKTLKFLSALFYD